MLFSQGVFVLFCFIRRCAMFRQLVPRCAKRRSAPTPSKTRSCLFFFCFVILTIWFVQIQVLAKHKEVRKIFFFLVFLFSSSSSSTGCHVARSEHPLNSCWERIKRKIKRRVRKKVGQVASFFFCFGGVACFFVCLGKT